ncbi:MAG TPA: cupin domain-containing protein, partial [Acidimicrobiia bacterium]|nr:cupin domain-containing protein [Acidimicrobiia bacterium]
ICDLVARLPEDRMEHNLGAIPEVLGGGQPAPRLDLPAADVARGMETNECWMVIRFVMQDPEYAELCNEVLDQVAAVLGPRYDLTHREAFIFLSGAASVTPTHTDPEHNFLLQVRGNKEFTVGHLPATETSDHFLENYYRNGDRNTPFPPDSPAAFNLEPGVGIYVPPHHPHFVKSRSDLALSLSVTWRPRELRREGFIYAFNGRRREHGANPRPFGQSPVRDRLKAWFESTASLARRGLKRARSAGVP